MTPGSELQKDLRRYLLGQLDDQTAEAFEKEFLLKDEIFDELLAAEDELIEDYLAETLTVEDRRALENHFLSTPDRLDQLRFGRTFRQYLSREGPVISGEVSSSVDLAPADAQPPIPSKTKSFTWWTSPQAFFASSWRAVAFAAVVLAVGFGAWYLFIHKSAVNEGLLALNSAYREQRPLESRISSFDYAPYVVTRGPGDERIDRNKLSRAELTLLNELETKPSPAVHHALGKVYLAKKDFDKAIDEFNESLKGDPNNAQTYSDLGAAWLEKAKLSLQVSRDGNGLEGLARSLEYLQKALELKPDLLPALFNRAICHEQMGLLAQAEDDWREYLQLDSVSPWAVEARQKLKHLQALQESSSKTKDNLLNAFHDAYRSNQDDKVWELVNISRDDLSGVSIFQQLVDSYLVHATAGQRDEAASDLSALAYVGALSIRKANDYYEADVAASFRSLPVDRLTRVVAACESMKRGYALYAQSHLQQAATVFEEAALAFRESGDEVQQNHAIFWAGYCYLEGLDTERGLAIFTRLAAVCKERNYRWLTMKTLQRTAAAKYNLKEYSLAIDYSNRAAILAEQIGDEIGIFDAQDQLTELYRSVNNYSEAMNSIAKSQTLVSCCPFNPIKLWRHYAIAALALYSAGFNAAAIDTQREAARRSSTTDDVSTISLSYAHLGLMYGKAGNFGEGLRNTAFAYDTASAHADEPSGKEMMAYSVLQSGHLYREQGRCEDALRSYDQAIDLYTNLKFLTQLYQAYKGRLSCYITQANPALASAELKNVLDLVEKNRSTIFEGENRYRFFDVEQNVYDLGISFLYAQLHDIESAFDLAEASRARSLLDLVLRGQSGTAGSSRNDAAKRPVSLPLSRTEIQQTLPPNSQIVAYSVLPDRTLIWVLNRQFLQARTSNISEATLDEKVHTYLTSIASPGSGADSVALGHDLFAVLIAPVTDLLDPSKQLVIVSDKSLNQLPFSALISDNNRYLIQDYPIVYAPSASLFILKSKEAAALNLSQSERVLSVGNPAFDAAMYPTLNYLPTAQTEAHTIAGFYPNSKLVVGSDATKQVVMKSLLHAEVVHLALHAIEDYQTEMHSKLILAKDASAIGDGYSTLEASEIGNLALPSTHLVVLSACETGAGRYYRGEGTFSLARSFLVAGVPVVIASLWPVESEATSDLMIKFHQHRALDHYSSARALQQAQLDLITSADPRVRHPYFWASFVIQGGYSTF
jgi:CHAT domain-containing protein/tetratricopeptide (TPR) repeat protein